MLTPLYCRKCGTRMPSDSLFCPACGAAQTGTDHTLTNQPEQDPALFGTGRLPAGRMLNQRYRLVQTLGQGGMGAVYAAQDTQLGDRLVAVKEMSMRRLTPQEVSQAVAQFQREAYLLASLHHPNLPAIHEYFREDDRWYLVMSFIEGQTLQAVLNAAPGKKLPVAEAVRIGIELCEVLDYLHTHKPQIIFRDLKPLNIMLTPKGHICLIDFGIARHFKPDQTRDTAHYYSVGYAPPEQYGQSQTGPRSDIYSLGATLHQMLSGQHPAQNPFQFSPLQALNQTISAPLATVVAQMVEMNEQARPGSVAEVKTRLQSVLTSPLESTPGGGAEHGTERLKSPLSGSSGPMSSETVPTRPEQAVVKTSALPDENSQPSSKLENVPLRRASAVRLPRGVNTIFRSWDKTSTALLCIIVVLIAGIAFPRVSDLYSHISPVKSASSSLTPSPSPTVDATAVAEYNRYLQATGGTPTFSDSLANNDNNNWFVGQHGEFGKCYFENQAYHVTANPGYVHYCGAFTSPINSLADFAFQIRITFVQGDAGGFVFRLTNGKGYVFFIRQDGTYTIYRYDGTNNIILSSDKNPAIATGQGKQNLLSALIQNNTFDFFVNNQYITSISDNTYSQGSIGVWAASFSASPVDIAFQNMKVWKLQ